MLGLGPMGQALAGAAVAAGQSVVVWNRTPDKARRLVVQGATLAPSVAEAVLPASLVIGCVMNYGALRAMVGDVVDWSGTTFVNLTSGLSAEARDMAAWAAERHLDYLDGAILTPAPTIGTPAASILYSGPRPVFDRSRSALDALAGAIYLGDDIGAAVAYETALLDFFAMAVGGLAHSFALASAAGIAPPAFAPFAKGIGDLLPRIIDGFAEQLVAGRFPGQVSTIASASSAINHVIEASDAYGIDAATLHAVQTVLDGAIAAGHADEGYARLAQFLTQRMPLRATADRS